MLRVQGISYGSRVQTQRTERNARSPFFPSTTRAKSGRATHRKYKHYRERGHSSQQPPFTSSIDPFALRWCTVVPLRTHTVGGPSSSKSLRNDDDFPEGTYLFHPVIPAMLPMFSMLLYNSHQRGPRADMLQQQHKIIQTNTSKTRAECPNQPARRSRRRRRRMSIKFTENFRVETIA